MPVMTRRVRVAPAAQAIAGILRRVGRGGLRSIICSPMVTRSNPKYSARSANSAISQYPPCPSTLKLQRVEALAQERYSGINHTQLDRVAGRAGVSRVVPTHGKRAPGQGQSVQPTPPPPHRCRRQRLPQEGILQLHGSYHAWPEDLGPWLTLLLAVDDATGTEPSRAPGWRVHLVQGPHKKQVHGSWCGPGWSWRARPSVADRQGFSYRLEAVLKHLEHPGISRRQAAQELAVGYATFKRLLDARSQLPTVAEHEPTVPPAGPFCSTGTTYNCEPNAPYSHDR